MSRSVGLSIGWTFSTLSARVDFSSSFSRANLPWSLSGLLRPIASFNCRYLDGMGHILFKGLFVGVGFGALAQASKSVPVYTRSAAVMPPLVESPWLSSRHDLLHEHLFPRRRGRQVTKKLGLLPVRVVLDGGYHH